MTELQQAGAPGSVTARARPPALIALGANLPGPFGGPGDAVRAAIDRLALLAPVTGRSRLYRTPAHPAGSGPDFVNAAVALDWPGPSLDLLQALHAIEADMGRTRRTRWGPRLVDLDLVARGDEVAPDAATQAAWREIDPGTAAQVWPDRLILPHPRLQERVFVLVPLADIAPDWTHPGLGLDVAAMLKRLPAEETAGIVPVG